MSIFVDTGRCKPLPLSSPLLLLTAALTLSAKPTAYEALRNINFPEGFLPQGVTRYELDESSGNFHADLNGSCRFSLQDLRGINVTVLFLWVNILEVVRKGDDLDFSVGFATTPFPLDSFFDSPQCGCGLDCDILRIRKLKLNTKNPSLSSA
ncbi:unnamed protein product [Lathyrus oleraceus]